MRREMIKIEHNAADWRKIADAAERVFGGEGDGVKNPSVIKFAAGVVRCCRRFNPDDVVVIELHVEAFTILAAHARLLNSCDFLGAFLEYEIAMEKQKLGTAKRSESSPRAISADAKRLRAEDAAGQHEYDPRYLGASDGEPDEQTDMVQGGLF